MRSALMNSRETHSSEICHRVYESHKAKVMKSISIQRPASSHSVVEYEGASDMVEQETGLA